jgi:hypothetical protein
VSGVRVKTVATEVLEVKTSGPLGQAVATFARFNVKDHDGDVVLPTAIKDGTRAVVSPYNHSSVTGGVLPAGAATIRKDGDRALADVQFFLTTEHGRASFETVRSLAELGLGEWSFAFRTLDAEPGTLNGESVTYLKDLDIFEVSPVIRGAGIGTRTESAKERQALDELRRIRDQLLGTNTQPTEAKNGDPIEEAKRIRSQILGTPGNDEAQASTMREFLRYQQLRAAH